MESVFSFVVGLLTAALSLLGFVQQHPELPPATRDQAQQVAQQAIMQATQALTKTHTQTPTATQTSSKTYTNNDFGISFSHPNDWQCKTSKPDIAHPDWFQSICDNDGVWEGDAFFGVSVPFVAEDHELWIKVRDATITGQNSSSIKKTVYRSAGLGGSIGMVEYIFSGSASARSYSAHALYGSGKPYKTAEEAETVLDAIVKTIVIKSIAAAATISNTLFSHPNDGYAFTYDSSKLEARATTATEFPSGSGLLPSSAVFSGGGYGQEAEILTYRGSIDAAQEAFIGSYRKYYSPQVLGTENVTINGNPARIVTYRVSPSYPEAKMYLIAYPSSTSRTIVATGEYKIISTISIPKLGENRPPIVSSFSGNGVVTINAGNHLIVSFARYELGKLVESSQRKVFVSDRTSIRTEQMLYVGDVPATIHDIHGDGGGGSAVSVVGSLNTDGTVTADSIIIKGHLVN